MNYLIEADNANALYKLAAQKVMQEYDYKVAPRGLEIKETINTTLCLSNPRSCIVSLNARNISRYYLAGELLWYLTGSNDLATIAHYSKFWNKVSDDGKTVNSCYGKYLFFDHNVSMLNGEGEDLTQYEYAHDCLVKDKDSRKALMTIYRPDKHSRLDSKDNPCTISLQFLIRNNALCLITNMRSNDLWYGFTYDLPFFCMLQQFMLTCLKDVYPDIRLGSYIHNAASFHAYKKDYAGLQGCLDEMWNSWHEGEMQLPEVTQEVIKELPKLALFAKELRTNPDMIIGPENGVFETQWCKDIGYYLLQGETNER